jgi:hypothetical protein
MLRDFLVTRLKATLWVLLRRDGFMKLARMISEERDIALCARTTQRLGPIVAERLGMTVRRGPFAGLRYPTLAAAGSTLIPKILGSYEREIQPAVERVCERGARLIVNVGAAEGYYAVGLAQRLPEAKVVAFEANPDGRRLLAEMTRANGVADRVEVRGFCHIEDLRALPLGPGTLVVSDCEGGEYALLDPAAVPALAQCDLLVEIHRARGREPSTYWRDLLTATHELEFINVRGREPDDYPELSWLPFEDRYWLVYERSGGGTDGWMLALARQPARVTTAPVPVRA